LVAFGFLTLVVLAAVFAGVLAPYDPLKQDLSHALQGPGHGHWLGTDELGRDVLSRLLFAARVSLKASVLAVGIALLIGFPLGLLVGYRGGRWESVTMRVSDGMMALPGLLIVIAVIGVLGNGILPAMIALGVVLAPAVLRLTRAVGLGIRNEPYIEAVKVLGLPSGRIVRRHVLPHVVPAMIVQTSLLLGAALLVEAGLSFLGLGVQPPEAGWGSMLSKGASLFREQSFVLIPPGVMITLTVLALNVLGDTVRDAVRWTEPSVPSRAGQPASDIVSAGVSAATASGDPGVDRLDDVLQVRGLTVAFGVGGQMLAAVTGVDLTVRAGHTVGIVGESGCGKTITARAAMSLLPAEATVVSGSIRLFGQELIGLPEAQLCAIRGDQVAMIFQDPASSLDPTQTIGDQIGESLRVHRGLSRRAARQRAEVLLGQVGIAETARRVHAYPHEFSGGMLQRVAIAAALACDPALLIADEPTTALDVTVQAEILMLLRELQEQRSMSMLIVTHDLGVVADVCDDVVVMYAGQVVEAAPVRTLFRAPQHPYSRALMAAMPRPEQRGGDLATIRGNVPPLGAYPIGCRFADRCDSVRAECREHPVEVRVVEDVHAVRCVLAEQPAR
jgi:peptide/nickel transport system permease protein